ncbi:armadillo-type protein [Dichotomocladium elegans]|nr:armadillo-type protein [Dichotomocladium elegans]
MSKDDTRELTNQLETLTKELSDHSDENKLVSQILLKRAIVYQQLGNLELARADVRTAIQRNPANEDAKELAKQLFSTSSSLPAESSASKSPAATASEDQLALKLQSYLKQLETNDIEWIKSFVRSTDFMDVLVTCGGSDHVSTLAKSTAYMILTKLFNPPPNLKNYPLQLIIETCAKCFSQCIDSGKNKEKLLAYTTLYAIFETSMTIGAAILSQEGTVEEMMDVIDFEIVPVQTAMVNVLAISSADKTCHKLIVKYASRWLAYTATRSKDEQLKAIAGTTLSKLQTHQKYQDNTSTSNESDNSLREAMDKMNLDNADLTDAMLGTIKNAKNHDNSVVLNAVEGLAYSTLQTDTKETVANDPVLIKSIVTLALNAAKSNTSNPLLFGIGTIFRNITMYKPVLNEQQQQMKKLQDLANAKNKSKQDEIEDPRDQNPAVDARVSSAVDNGVALALLVLAKNSSENLRTVAAQTYLNLVTPQSTRGKLLQQGVVKGLLPLATAKQAPYQLLSAQALARLAITTDPRIAFGPQVSMDLVIPFLALCKDQEQQLGQFEGLMALTNLASVDDNVRDKIERENGMTTFENLQFSSNEMIQRAATEMICNMTFCDAVFDQYSKSQKRLRLLMIFSDHEDPATRRAASGALAILSNSQEACANMTKVDRAYERITRLVQVDEEADVQHRGIEIIRLLLEHLGKEAVDNLVTEQAHLRLAEIVVKCKVDVVRSAAMDVLKVFVNQGVQINK